jgi:protein gp37
MSKTTIAWTDESLNPFVGCTKVSPGCAHCYAETAAASPRLQQFDQYKTVVNGNGRWNGHVEFVPKMLDKLFTYKKPRRIFMPSMSDPFHPAVKDEWLDQMMAAIALNPHLTFQVLTKRPQRMMEYYSRIKDIGENWCSEMAHVACDKEWRKWKQESHSFFDSGEEVCFTSYQCFREIRDALQKGFQNLWLGVTVENQAAANDRIPLLQQTPAAVRFLSVEPMLELVQLYLGNLNGDAPIHQVIVGGESGSNAREFHLEWADDIQRQCKITGTKFFMKQVGSNAYYHGQQFKTKSRAGTDPDEWPEHLKVQESPGENNDK